MTTPAQVLAATRWSDLGLPRDADGMRAARRALHPDTCHEPGATEAFTRLEALFEASDIDLRLATGTMVGPGVVRWDFDPADADLARVGVEVAEQVRSAEPIGWAPRTRADGDHVISEHGPGWWPLSDFGTLDERTVVWVAKRALAASAVAERLGWVHGDIFDLTVWLEPEAHGLHLDSWHTAVRVGGSLVATPHAKTLPRWMGGEPVSGELACSQIAAMASGHDCGPLADLFEELRLRPVDPSRAFARVDEAAKSAFGAPSWHPLARPAGVR